MKNGSIVSLVFVLTRKKQGYIFLKNLKRVHRVMLCETIKIVLVVCLLTGLRHFRRSSRVSML